DGTSSRIPDRPDHQRRKWKRLLGVAHEQAGIGCRPQLTVSNVRRDADDLHLSRVTPPDPDPLSDRVLVGKQDAGGGEIENRNVRRSDSIPGIEIAALEEPNAH